MCLDGELALCEDESMGENNIDGVTPGITPEQIGDWTALQKQSPISEKEQTGANEPVGGKGLEYPYKNLTPYQAARVAYAEKPGTDLAYALDKEKNGEMSDIQKENVKAMEKLREKFPNAFIEKVYGDQRVLEMVGNIRDKNLEKIIFTKNGIFEVKVVNGMNSTINDWMKYISLKYDKVADSMGEPKTNENVNSWEEVPGGKDLIDGEIPSWFIEQDIVVARRLVFSDDIEEKSRHDRWTKDELVGALNSAEDVGKHRKEQHGEIEKMAHMLSDLASSI